MGTGFDKEGARLHAQGIGHALKERQVKPGRTTSLQAADLWLTGAGPIGELSLAPPPGLPELADFQVDRAHRGSIADSGYCIIPKAV